MKYCPSQGAPWQDDPDDTICVHCQSPLPPEDHSDFQRPCVDQGYCSAMCLFAEEGEPIFERAEAYLALDPWKTDKHAQGIISNLIDIIYANGGIDKKRYLEILSTQTENDYM